MSAHRGELTAAGGQCIRLHKVLSADAQEVRLYCHSPGREQKETAIITRLPDVRLSFQKIALKAQSTYMRTAVLVPAA